MGNRKVGGAGYECRGVPAQAKLEAEIRASQGLYPLVEVPARCETRQRRCQRAQASRRQVGSEEQPPTMSAMNFVLGPGATRPPRHSPVESAPARYLGLRLAEGAGSAGLPCCLMPIGPRVQPEPNKRLVARRQRRCITICSQRSGRGTGDSRLPANFAAGGVAHLEGWSSLSNNPNRLAGAEQPLGTGPGFQAEFSRAPAEQLESESPRPLLEQMWLVSAMGHTGPGLQLQREG